MGKNTNDENESSVGFWVTAFSVILIIAGIVMTIVFWDQLILNSSAVEVIRTIGLVVGGAIAFCVTIWRSSIAQKQAAAAAHRSHVAAEQASIADQGLLNERYQKGAEMLGHHTLSVRFAGIYDLRALANEEVKKYHIQIMRLFCAFIRNPTRQQVAATETEANANPHIRADVQAVIEAICNRSTQGITLEREEHFELDFNGAQLGGMKLGNPNADLEGALFIGADLSHADLTGAKMRNAIFLKSKLHETKFKSAELSGTVFADEYDKDQDPIGLTQAQLTVVAELVDGPPPGFGNLRDPESGYLLQLIRGQRRPDRPSGDGDGTGH